MKVWGFLALRILFLFLVRKIGKMSEFSINGVLRDFKIVKGMLSGGYSRQVSEIHSSKIRQMELGLRAYLGPASYPYVWSYPSASVWSHISTESRFPSLGLPSSTAAADSCALGDAVMISHHPPSVCAAPPATFCSSPHPEQTVVSKDAGQSEPGAEGRDAPLESSRYDSRHLVPGRYHQGTMQLLPHYLHVNSELG